MVLCNFVCPVCLVHSADCVSSFAIVRSNTVAVVLGMPAFTGCPDYRGGRIDLVLDHVLGNGQALALMSNNNAERRAVYAVLLVPVVVVLALLPASCVPVLTVL